MLVDLDACNAGNQYWNSVVSCSHSQSSLQNRLGSCPSHLGARMQAESDSLELVWSFPSETITMATPGDARRAHGASECLGSRV